VSEALHLVVLVAGADEKAAIEKLLAERAHSLGIRRLRVRVLKHPRRDPGCYQEAPDVLRPFVTLAQRALVVFDREGSGQEERDARAIAADLRARLARSGWDQRAAVIVIDPELEAWVWSDSPHVKATLGWTDRRLSPRQWLAARGEWPAERAKPPRPKECLEAVLRKTTRRFSSAIFAELAGRVSLEHCVDPAFRELGETLREWFATPERG
jgi:hypothetical protein